MTWKRLPLRSDTDDDGIAALVKMLIDAKNGTGEFAERAAPTTIMSGANMIDLSESGHFVVAWNNGNKVYCAFVGAAGIHAACAECRAYLKLWAGDEEPILTKALRIKMAAADSNLQRMAYGGEYR